MANFVFRTPTKIEDTTKHVFYEMVTGALRIETPKGNATLNPPSAQFVYDSIFAQAAQAIGLGQDASLSEIQAAIEMLHFKQ